MQEAVVLVLLYSSAFQLTSDYRNSLMNDSHCFSTIQLLKQSALALVCSDDYYYLVDWCSASEIFYNLY